MKYRFLITRYVCIMIAIGSMIQLGTAAELPRPFFNVTTPENKELIVENLYIYKTMRYDPPSKIKLLNKESDASFETPEQTLIAHFSAMFSLDYNWFLKGWSRESQQEIKDTDKAKGRTSEFWAQAWAKWLKNRGVEFVTRIESGEYVLIEYRLFNTKEKKPDFTNTAVLKLENGKWVLTNELAADPVPVSWKNSNQRLKKFIR